ncbi:MAG: type III-A CRISPR-associated protein Cas10/Csm1 [Bacteroidetes bacterium]|nr:type III-A CRISPR-associated protein Cas10/Csm1 [Bacteroidota bacterium]
MYSPEEKILILGALFHDIGKYVQRCTGNPGRKFHSQLAVELVSSGQFQHHFERILMGDANFRFFTDIILKHHDKSPQGLVKHLRDADHLSASERVDKEEVEVYRDQWKHKHLCSLFSKIDLLLDEPVEPRYYKHINLTKDDYDVIIPHELTDEQIQAGDFSYTDYHLTKFKNDLEAVLEFYKDESDFDSLMNLLLIIFEKYLWCIPDFTGSSETDISLFNHLKDVTAFAHIIYLTQKVQPKSNNLNLIIGDIPGIQNYIFDVVNRKPAKILRGRSIFIQILTRNFASIFLRELSLTEANLIMHAGGKFYIVAPSTDNFSANYESAKFKIESYLFENFRMELTFNSAYETFDYTLLMEKDQKKRRSFGNLIETASLRLLQSRYKIFENRLFNSNTNSNFVWAEDYINDDGSGTDSIKCRVTDKPIRKNQLGEIKIPSDSGLKLLSVSKQVELEYTVGHKVTNNNTIIIIDKNDNLTVNEIVELKNFDSKSVVSNHKIILNPNIDQLLNKENLKKDVFRNAHYLEVANYCSRDDENDILPFEKIAEENEGAEFLTLIKGDIDNLGLLMAYGLVRDFKDSKDETDEKDLTAISRTTTLSNHLKYFFSFFLNGFLSDWELEASTNKVYTIFAGGDDLMLITPQCSAVKLIEKINSKFNEFSCCNNEVHMSYSITHFKDHTPIRLVSEFAEKGQLLGKKYSKESQQKLLQEKNPTSFRKENDKSGTYLFNSFIKNDDLKYFLSTAEELVNKSKQEKGGLSHGLIRKLFQVSETLKKFQDNDDASYLITYARLNHAVKRLLKDKDKSIQDFFSNVLLINKEGNEEAQKLAIILYPLVCQVIYNIRK